MTRRAVATFALLVAVTLACVATLAAGALGIAPADQPAALTALLRGDGDLVLGRLRGPRLATAIGAGAALGLAGALFQRATSNPLVTPDVIGITAAAGTGTAIATTAGWPPALGALAGAAVAGALIPLTTGSGFRNPVAVVIAGIGIAAAASAATQLVVVRLGHPEALALASALTGSLSARTWGDAFIVCGAAAALGAVAAALRPGLGLLALGDQAAHALGSRPGAVRTGALLTGIALTAAAVCAAGPVTFVALTAPHAARWFTGRPALLTAALTGALTVVAADLAVIRVPALAGLPVGVVTALLGSAFLGALLLTHMRKGTL